MLNIKKIQRRDVDMSSNVNEVRLQGKLKRVDLRTGMSKANKEYASVTYTLDIEGNEVQVKSFSMRFKKNGDELSGYKGIMSIYNEAKAMHKTFKVGDGDAVVESAEHNSTIVGTIEECDAIKTSSYKDFKYCRFETNVRKDQSGNIVKAVEVDANYVNRVKEEEEYKPKNYFVVTGQVVTVPIELEDADEKPYIRFNVLVPVFNKGYTRADGEEVEDKVVLHEIEMKSYDEATFDFIADEFEKGSFVQLNGRIVRTVNRIEKEIETDDGRRSFGRKAEVKKDYETKIVYYIDPLGGFKYEDPAELTENEELHPEFRPDLWEKGLKAMDDKIKELNEGAQAEEQPRGFVRRASSIISDDELPF